MCFTMKKNELIWTLLIANISCLFGCSYAAYYLMVNTSEIVREMHHFWKSTGFCPPMPHQDAYKYDLSKDMEHNLAYIGSIPNRGMEQVRIHWLLDLILVKRLESHKPVYDFSKLDMLIYKLWKNGLKPGFELMGSPSNFFSDFENKTQLYLYKDLVQEIAERYINIYGLKYVRTWNFETWNEPDCHDFDRINMTVQGFLNYYDACSEGLKGADLLLKFGGPGDGCNDRHFKYADALIQHVVNGTNYFTGHRDVRIDFISFHRKGNGSSKTILLGELEIISKIKLKYPKFGVQTPFYNDEADPLVGWSKSKWWRADATYAAMVTKVIAQHQNIILSRDPPMIFYKLLSNDNGFLSYYPHQFTQRTLNARFQMNNTSPVHVQFIRKPVHSVLVLLSLLGEYQVKLELKDQNWIPVQNYSRIGALASVHLPGVMKSADCWQLSVVIYYSDDTYNSTNPPVLLHTSLLFSHFDKNYPVMLALYSVDNNLTNPYNDWLKYGKPNYPTRWLFERMRRSEGPIRVQFFQSKAGNIKLHPFYMYHPMTVLIHICAKSLVSPGEVIDLTIYNITSGQVLIRWSDDLVSTKCIKTFEVEYSSISKAGPYSRINDYDIIVTVFVYVAQIDLPYFRHDNKVHGYYRVRAIDYWGRPGIFSNPKKYPS